MKTISLDDAKVLLMSSIKTEMDSTTQAFNQSAPNDDYLSVMNIIVIIIDIILIIVIFGGNLLTLLAVWRTRRLRTVPNMYVVSLAVADLLAGLIVPYQMLIFFPGMQYLLDTNVYFCLLRYCFFFVSGSESILCLAAISIDRWIYISRPLHYQNLVTPTRAGVVIACTWLAALFYGSVPLFNNNWTPTTKCKLFNVLTLEYQVYVQATSYVFACIVCVFAHFNIFIIARRQRRAIADINRVGSNRAQMRKSQKDWDLVKLFMLVFGLFFICWTPTFVAVIFGHTMTIPTVVMDVCGPLSVLNSGINFFIYAFKNKDFRQAFTRILCGKKHADAQMSVQSQTDCARRHRDVEMICSPPPSENKDLPISNISSNMPIMSSTEPGPYSCGIQLINNTNAVEDVITLH